MKITARIATVFATFLAAITLQAVPTVFTGSYSTNFDAIGAAGTTMPLGFRTMVTGSGNSVYTAAIPISTAGIAAATASGTQTLTVWNAGAAVASSSTSLFNVGAFGNTSDRALGSDATSVAAMVIELSLTNKIGSNLLGVVFNYDVKCQTNGSVGNESSELPGYSFFYSTSGGTTAAEWTRVDGLSIGNYTQGSVSNSGNVTITFPTPLTNNGIMYFRWADDNNVANSPDQMLAIDNIVINTSTNTAPTVTLTAPLNGANFAAGTNITLSATATDANGTVTRVEFFNGAVSLGVVSNAPYNLVWSNVVLGSYSLTARATDNDGAVAASTAATINVVPDLGTGGLYFDGVNDYVTFGAATNTLGVTNFTVECWFKRTGTGASTSTGTGGVTGFPLITKGRAEADGSNVDCNWFLGFDVNGKLIADFEDFNNGLNHPITGNAAFTSNAWQHAAVTYSASGTNGTWTLYLNGVLDATNNFTGTNTLVVTPRYDSIQHAGLATAMTSVGLAAGFFNGKLDEARVWNYARSAQQIADNFTRPIPTATGLIGRWSLDETNGLIASNSIVSGVNGTLTNGLIRVAGYPFANNVAITSPTNNASFDAPANIAIAATASSLTGSVTNMEYFAGATSVGSATTAPFSVTWNGAAVGSYALTAIATDDGGILFTSPVVNVSVVVADLPATVTAVVSPTNGATDVAKSPTLGVTVSDPEGATNLTVTFYGRKVLPTPAADFTLIALPDTQFYSETYSNVFFAQTDWIVANRAASNIVYVAQLGDCVQNGDKGGNDNEWRNATNALYRMENPLTTLLSNGIPYGVAVGNHDQGATGNGVATDTTTFYNQYFGMNHFLPYNYYGGNYGTNNDNHYDLFSANGYDFIAIYFEYDTTMNTTNLPVLNWANNLLKTYPNRRGIVVSHYIIDSYTAGSTFGTQGGTIYNALKANTNLSLMLCGHVNPNGEGRRTDVYNGSTVQTLLSDYQDLANGGNGWLRLYTFSPSNNVIRAQTYSPFLGTYQTGANSQFTVPYALTPTNPFTVIGTVTGISSGSNALVTWAALKANMNYEWYATVSDGHSTSTGTTVQFATSTNFPLVPPTVALTSPANNSTFPALTNLTLTATAADADGLVTNVAFFRNGTKFADVASAPFNFTLNTVVAGNYAFTAVSTDDDGLTATSSVVNVSVTNSTAVQLVQQIGNIFVIAMENHNFAQPSPGSNPQQISNNVAAPFMNSLITPGHTNAQQVSFALRYYNAGIGVHPSEPSYVWAEAGTDFGIHTDADPRAANNNVFTADHLTRQLNTAGIPWRSYQEDLQYSTAPTNSASGSGAAANPYYGTGQYDYAVKHNPMAFFNDTQIQNVSAMTNFLRDLTNNSIGRYNWITPNQFNDAHSALSGGFTYRGTSYTGDQASIAQGDNFLSIIIPRIMASDAYKSNGVIVVWWDESEGGDSTSYTIPCFVISPLCKGNGYASPVEYNHSTLIKTVEELFNLPFLTNAIPPSETKASGSGYNFPALVNDFSDMFQFTPRLNIVPGGTNSFGTVNLGASATNNFTVTNSGPGTLNLTALNFSGLNADNFATGGITLPAAIAPNGSATFQIIFTPSAAGVRSAALQITNNDVVRSPLMISLNGTGNAQPIVTVPATITVEATNASGNVMIFSVTANDAEDGALTPLVNPASGSTFPLGTNLVTATANDSNNFIGMNSFLVIVRDTAPPIITLNGANPFTNFQSVAFGDPGATASDLVSGIIAVTTNSTVNVNVVGNYSVQYIAADAAGNAATNTRSVQIITLPAPGELNGAVAIGGSGFQLSFTGAIGQPYRVLGTDDLSQPATNWIVLTSGIVTTNPVVFTDPAITNALRFYQIVSP